jgi:thiol:disulfide interchange protein DsbD
MRFRFSARWLVCCLIAFSLPAFAQVYQGRTLVEPSLIADTTAIVPGQPFRVGLLLKTAPGWHTYWQYGGDAGIATDIKWQLPAGFKAGPINWPLPTIDYQKEADILTYVYKDEVLLTQTIQPPSDLAEGSSVELKADASWLVCAEICIPGKASGLTLKLPVGRVAEAANASEFEKWTSRLPSTGSVPFPVTWSRAGDQLSAKISPPAGTTAVEFFPLPPEDDVIGHPAISGNASEGFTMTVEAKTNLPGVLAITDASGLHGWSVKADPSAAVAASATPVSAPAAVVAPPVAAPSLFAALLGGLLGGLILNLMPCVLPVISLKIFGFVQQAGQSRRRIALHGLTFSAGIFAWFLGLGALIVALRSSGALSTWGAQFQNPWFNLGIAILVFVFALNLFGVFELTLPGRTTTKLSEAGSRDGYGGSFFQGVFATLLATPCTGPFLGSSLGFAFAQPAPITLLLFASMATGMALPYLALSIQPGWVRFLPKPGAWMERLKQFMGFPMLAALLWLLFIIGAQRGATAIIWAAAFLLVLGVALWMYGAASSPTVKPRNRLIVQLLAAGLAILGGWVFLVDLFANEQPPDTSSVVSKKGGIDWVPYSTAEVDKLLASGKPVFIDFTAAWCLSCKYNERTAIDTAAVRQKFKDLGIVTVKADWTNANPEITAALQKFGRVGVPFYVLYPAGKPDAPITLPEIITASLVLDALSKSR